MGDNNNKLGFAELLEDCSSKGTKLKTDDYLLEGKYAIVDQGQQLIAGYTDIEDGVYADIPAIIFGDHTRVVKYVDVPFFLGADGTKLLKVKKTGANYKYLYYALKAAHIPNTGYNRHFKWVKELEFNYPSDEEQMKIVELLDRLQSLMDKRNEQLEELDTLIKARFVELFGEPEHNTKGLPTDTLGNLCSVGSSKRIYKSEQTMEGIPFLRISDLVNLIDSGTLKSDLNISEERYSELVYQGQVPVAGDILVTSRGTLGRCYIVGSDDRFYFQDGMISWLSNLSSSITPLYVSFLFSMEGFRKQIDKMQAGSTVSYLSITMLKKLEIMIPSSELQELFAAFVAKVDKSKFDEFHIHK